MQAQDFTRRAAGSASRTAAGRSGEQEELADRVVAIKRVAKVQKGGRRFSFSAVVVVGDLKGQVGIGLGKANEVPESIRKGMERAKKGLFRFALFGTTVPYKVVGRFGAARVMLRPAAKGTGIIAGGALREVLEVSGIRDVLTKTLGTNNPHNVVKAAVDALQQLRTPEDIEQMRSRPTETTA